MRGRSPAAAFLAAVWTSSGRSGDGEGWGAARGVGAAAGVWSARAAPRRTTRASAWNAIRFFSSLNICSLNVVTHVLGEGRVFRNIHPEH